MFLTVTYLLASLWQWHRDYRQRDMYLRIVKEFIKHSSVVFHRRSAHSSRRVSFLEKVLRSNVTRNVVWDDGLQILAVEPNLIINLKDWNIYRDGVEKDLAGTTFSVLLEADKHAVDLESNSSALLTNLVQVHDCSQPLAWKAGFPCTVVVNCSLQNIIRMVMALKNGLLLLEEGLIVSSIISLSTVGSASNLLLRQSIRSSARHHTDSDSSQGVDDLDLCCRSNESLASACETEDDPNQRLQEDTVTDTECTESELDDAGAGETISDDMDVDSAGADGLGTRVFGRHSAKPPNVLVYCGKKDSVRKFNELRGILEQCLNMDRYLIYHLKHNRVHSDPWIDNTELLVLSCDNLYDGVDQAALQFFHKGGKLISFGSSLDVHFLDKKLLFSTHVVLRLDYEKWSNVAVLGGRHVYVGNVKLPGLTKTTMAWDKSVMGSLIVKVKRKLPDDKGTSAAVFSQVYLNKDPADFAIDKETFTALKTSNSARFEILTHLLTDIGLDCSKQAIPALTPAILLSQNLELKRALFENILPRLQEGVLKSSEVSLKFVGDSHSITGFVLRETLPVITNDDHYPVKHFNAGTYWKHLRTKVLGRVVLFVDIVPTTMPLLNQIALSVPHHIGLIAIAGRQTSGKGRGGNRWLSPEGCAMFTMHVHINLFTMLGQHIGFLQHIVAVAMVMSVRTLPGYEEIDLRIKWPNDLYFGNSMKIGGILVTCTTTSDSMDAMLGCGFNVANKNPTMCINDLIRQHNLQHGTSLATFDKDQLIARTVTIIEQLIDSFQTNGYENFRDLYYQYWLHSGATVLLESEGNIEVEILGLDSSGFLQVMDQGGRKTSLQPDDNSFDLMRNLIVLKARS